MYFSPEYVGECCGEIIFDSKAGSQIPSIKSGEEDEAGINGAIKHRSDNLATVNTVSMSSVEESHQKIAKASGRAITPKMAIPGVGYHAYYQNSEGNVFGIMQDDPSAK